MPVQMQRWSGTEWEPIANSYAPTQPGGGEPEPEPEPSTDRADLVKGVDRPLRGVTAGVLQNVARQDVFPSNGVYQMAPGEVLENKTIHGRVVGALGGVMRNVRVRGQKPKTSPGINDHYPLLSLTTSTINKPEHFLAEDCQFTPSPENESVMAYGVKGGGGTLRRCELSRVVDGWQMFGGDTTVEMCWIGDLTAINPDVTRSDGDATHNDGIQIEGGSWNYLIEGNTVDVRIDPMPTANDASLFGLLVTANQDSTKPNTNARVTIKNNWWRGGSYPVNPSAPLASQGSYTITGNRFQRGQQFASGKYWHIIAKLEVQAKWTFTGNIGVFPDWSVEQNFADVKQG